MEETGELFAVWKKAEIYHKIKIAERLFLESRKYVVYFVNIDVDFGYEETFLQMEGEKMVLWSFLYRSFFGLLYS